MNAPATVSPADGVESDGTGETDLVDNGDFLRAVFADDLADARPVVVSFAGNPTSVPAKVWFGGPWEGEPDVSTRLPASANTTSVSRYSGPMRKAYSGARRHASRPCMR